MLTMPVRFGQIPFSKTKVLTPKDNAKENSEANERHLKQ